MRLVGREGEVSVVAVASNAWRKAAKDLDVLAGIFHPGVAGEILSVSDSLDDGFASGGVFRRAIGVDASSGGESRLSLSTGTGTGTGSCWISTPGLGATSAFGLAVREGARWTFCTEGAVTCSLVVIADLGSGVTGGVRN